MQRNANQSNDLIPVPEQQHVAKKPESPRKRVGRRKNKEMFEPAIDYLKKQTVAVRGKEIIETLNAKGFEIFDSGNYFKGLLEYDRNVSKPYRGHYYYESKEEQAILESKPDDEPIVSDPAPAKD